MTMTCYCGGNLIPGFVEEEVVLSSDQTREVTFLHIPANICDACNESFVRPETTKLMLSLADAARGERVTFPSADSMTPNEAREAREAIGLSQAQLARFINVSPMAVSYWETGERKVSGPTSMLLRTLAIHCASPVMTEETDAGFSLSTSPWENAVAIVPPYAEIVDECIPSEYQRSQLPLSQDQTGYSEQPGWAA